MMTNEISFFLLIVHFCPLQRNNMLYGIDIYFRKIDTKVRKYFRTSVVRKYQYVVTYCTNVLCTFWKYESIFVRKYFRTKVRKYFIVFRTSGSTSVLYITIIGSMIRRWFFPSKIEPTKVAS